MTNLMRRMRAVTVDDRLIYVSRFRIPSERANCVQMLKMCAGFAAAVRVELVAPYHAEDARQEPALWDRFALARSFHVRWLAYPHVGERLAVRGFSLAATAYARVRRFPVAYTRDLWTAYWLARSGVRVGFEAHDLPEERRHPAWRRLVTDRGLSPALRGIFCITQALAEDYRAAGARPELLRTAPDGVDLQRFEKPLGMEAARKELGLDVDGPWIVHAGHLYPGRGAEELILALTQLNGARLLFVGGNPEDIQRLAAFARERGAAERVTFAGTVPNGKVPLYLWAADALAMPYTSRTLTVRSMSPLKMFEYMAAARPIVATDFPAVREVLRDGDDANAVIVRPDDPDALARGLRGVMADPEPARRIAARARRDVEAYSWDRRAADILEVLKA